MGLWSKLPPAGPPHPAAARPRPVVRKNLPPRSRRNRQDIVRTAENRCPHRRRPASPRAPTGAAPPQGLAPPAPADPKTPRPSRRNQHRKRESQRQARCGPRPATLVPPRDLFRGRQPAHRRPDRPPKGRPVPRPQTRRQTAGPSGRHRQAAARSGEASHGGPGSGGGDPGYGPGAPCRAAAGGAFSTEARTRPSPIREHRWPRLRVPGQSAPC